MEMQSHIALRDRVGFEPMMRLDVGSLDRELQVIASSPVMGAVLDAAGCDLVVVNEHLQIVAVNRRFLDRMPVRGSGPLIGQRIGEPLHCVHAAMAPMGCATNGACAFCGALNTILESRERGEPVVGECLLRCDGEAGELAAELSITATPLTIEERPFTVISLLDISDGKRREMLQRLFVHDIKNSLQGILGWSEILAENPESSTEKLANRISALTRALAEEVETHRMLAAAESDNLRPFLVEVFPADVIARIQVLFVHHEVAYGKRLKVTLPDPDISLETDPAVLRRVLVNMVTNALEATESNGEIHLGGEAGEDGFRFYVQNPGEMPDEVQANLFKRSFSTKASRGRGLGTYSMKLFGEKVLGGRVHFTSTGEDGTTFYLTLHR
jgi:signal transduction histidine kinase